MSSTAVTATHRREGAIGAGPREWAALAVLTLPVLLISVDMTVLGFAVPHLSEDLSPTSGQLLWIIDVYGFVLAGLLITMGSLGDRIGRRRLLLIGSAGFGLASLMAAFAPDPETLIAARALLGMAGATLMPSTLSLIRNIFLVQRQRLIAIAIWASGFSAGGALGPILGGWLLEHFWWGSVFLINLPVMALLLVAAPPLVRESRDPAPGRLDPLSVVLSMGAMLPAVYGVKKIASHGIAPLPALAIVVGLSVGIVFVRRQLRLPTPMIDVRLFAVRRFSVAVATNLVLVFALVASLFYLPQYLQLVLGMAPSRAGLVLVPGLLLSVLMSFVAVLLARRLGLGTIILLALGIISMGYFALTQAPLDNGVLLVAVAFGLIAGGSGLAETLTNDAIMTAVPPERAGAASAISETAYELGGALGVALLGSVLTASYRFRLDEVDGVPEASMDTARDTLGGAVTTASSLPAETGDALVRAAHTAFTDAMHLTSALAGVIIVAAAVHAGVLLRRARGPAAPAHPAAEPSGKAKEPVPR
ncbi:MFS transporter [Allosalinactinospora lopnorensis]|uniref:MFS transporter n=1 Tax=Allosalinactinospora lopnorensis TaxID=1352348 RepID=UPI000623D6CE|nr:MFS transporter [Allosalinactinospora lopnorensis]